MSFPARVASRAQDAKPARAVLTVLSFPFYVLGFVVGLVWLVILWACLAVSVGLSDVKERTQPKVTDGSR